MKDQDFFLTKPNAEELSSLCSGVDSSFIKRHAELLDEHYFTRFRKKTLADHVRCLSSLSKENPFELLVSAEQGERLTVTVLGFDFPGEFSLITGLLSAAGFNIVSGEIFTYRRAFSSSDESPALSRSRNRAYLRRRYRRGSTAEQDKSGEQRCIIDTFTGNLPSAENIGAWEAGLRQELSTVMKQLMEGSSASFEKAKQLVNEKVARLLESMEIDRSEILYPVKIEVDTAETNQTRITVYSEDTPFFLYSLSSALSLHDISITQVRIKTTRMQIEDEFYITDRSGRPVTNPRMLSRIKLSILFTKQFTYFLDKAPDPYQALQRFEQLTQDLLDLDDEDEAGKRLKDPRFLEELARLLGTSDFLWEDFIRLQYESLLPLLSREQSEYLSRRSADLLPELNRRIADAGDFEEKKKIINDFKNTENYLIDLDHILKSDTDFFFLSRKLTALAEAVVNVSLEITREDLVKKYGHPRTVAGLEAEYAVFGLGKLGGAALGYASDIELLFVYNDNGRTDGVKSVSNAEFFEELFKESVRNLESKREGIFQVDLRLRPFGSAGPVACSLENYCRYYGPGGNAHSFEKLALVRMRWIGGSEDLGRQVERIRDELIYAGDSIDLAELKELRNKQLAEKMKDAEELVSGKKKAKDGERLNAKFSAGGLVDLEYSVQILQIIYGKNDAQLRTPKIHQALEGLVRAGVMEGFEAERLVGSYHFLRHLINGLRMLRGNAKDLFLPPLDSIEYVHLARRMGYRGEEDLSPAEQLHIEFETRTAVVRTFVESQLGKDAIPGPTVGNAADIVLGGIVSDEVKDHVFSQAGFKHIDRSFGNLKAIAGRGARQELFAKLSILAWDILQRCPDPDMALNNWDRFVSGIEEPAAHFKQLLHQPRRLDLLLNIFSASQFLSDILILNPKFFMWVTSPEAVHTTGSRKGFLDELMRLQRESGGKQEWLNHIRRFRKREILRIGTRDICLKIDTPVITAELSALAAAVSEAALEYIFTEKEAGLNPENSGFCVLAFGKLGGNELNYSSDIDLLGIYDEAKSEQADFYTRIMEELRADLSAHSEEGYAYRVDLRLRPYGKSGPLLHSIPALERYYRDSAALWEIQALLKINPIAGDPALGKRFLEKRKCWLSGPWDADKVSASIHRLRGLAIKNTGRFSGKDIKNGSGGIRDIEFLLQGLQLIHIHKHPQILCANSIEAIAKLDAAGILDRRTAGQLRSDYLLLRRLEHFLQIYEDRQVHSLPGKAREREALAKRIAADMSPESFFENLDTIFTRVRVAYSRYLGPR